MTPAYDVATNPTFTIRFTGQSIAAAGVLPGAPGTADGPWVAVPAAELPVPVVPAPVVPAPVVPDPVAPVYTGTNNDGLFSFSWLTAGLVALGLLLRRKRF